MKNIVILSLVAALSLCPATMHGKKKQKKYAKTEVSLDNSKPVEQPMTPVTITNAKKQLEGEWDIVTLRKKPVSTPDRAYLYLDFKNFKVYGSTGCNDLNGRFQQSGANINFKDFITTERACHSATRERDILKALAEVQRMTMSTQYNIEYLNLMNSKGQVIMVLKHHNLDLMNGVWIVREADGVNVRDKNVRMVIDATMQTLHGNTGCNIINGIIHIDASKDHAIQFEDIHTTGNVCDDMTTETAILVALEQTESCKRINDAQVALLDHKGRIVLMLDRTTLPR